MLHEHETHYVRYIIGLNASPQCPAISVVGRLDNGSPHFELSRLELLSRDAGSELIDLLKALLASSPLRESGDIELVIGCDEGSAITFDPFRRIGVFTTVIEVISQRNAVQPLRNWGWKIGRSRLFQNAEFVVDRLKVAADNAKGPAVISGLQSRSIRTDESLVLAVLLALWRAV